MKRLLQQLGVILLVLCWSYSVRAADVTLMPVTVKLDRANDRATVQVLNNGQEPVLMQAEAIAWHRVGGIDVDGPTTDLIVNPPVFTVQPGQTQVLRLGLRRSQELAQEGTYRIVLREVPMPRPSDVLNVAGSVRVLVALRVPVYVAPAQVKRSEQWKVSRTDSGELLAQVSNDGNVHLKVSELRLHGEGGQSLAMVAQKGGHSVIFPGEHRTFRLPATATPAMAMQVQTDQGPQMVALNDVAGPRRPELRLGLAALLLLLIAAGAIAQTPRPEFKPNWGETLLLALRVNGLPQDGMLRAVRLAEGLAIPQSNWNELNLRLPTAGVRVIDGEQHVLLATVGPLRWQVEEATQTLEIDAPAAAFVGQRLDLTPGLPRVTQPSVWAPFVNYDAQWQNLQTRTGSRSSADALWELGLLGPVGDFSSSHLTRKGSGSVRLDTRWQRDDTARLARLRVGDAISQAGAWGRALRYGGLQWGTDFALQPGFLSFPLPTLRGEAALPSTLDVYVNNSQRLQSRLQAGPFDLNELPVVTGQGQIRTVVRDLLGREQVVVTPYYVSPALLKPGLSAVHVDVGAEREDYGLASNRYGRAMASVTERRGVTDSFTRELRLEASGHRQAAGATGWVLWPKLGTASLSAVASRASGRGNGWMLMAGLDRQARDWSGSLQLRHASARFSQLGQDDATAPRTVLVAAVGSSWGGNAIGMSLARQQGGAVQTKIAQLNYSRDLGNWGYLGAIVFRDLSRGGGGTSIGLSWSRALDARHSTGVSVQRQPTTTGGSQTVVQAQLQRNPAFGSGLGYQLMAESGNRQLAQAQWQGEHAVLSGGIGRRGGTVDARAGATGGLAWVEGSAFAGRRIEGGIAVVDVGGHPAVRVTQDNQVVARTDARGRAFVTGLRGYQPNRVGIEAADLPMDAELQALEIQLTPAARSAARIDFPVQRGRAASLRLFELTGDALPPGTLLSAMGRERAFPVGLGGRSYLAGLADGRNEVQAQWRDAQGAPRQCRFEFTLPPARGDDLPDLGDLICR